MWTGFAKLKTNLVSFRKLDLHYIGNSIETTTNPSLPKKCMTHLRGPVPELSQDFRPVVWNDAHGIAGEGEFFQTGKSSNVLYFIQLEEKT